MEASINKTLKTDWILWHPLKPSVWGECSTCLTLILFPHLNTIPSLSTHRLGSGNWSLADAVWKEVKHVTSTGSGVKPPRAALQALSPICQVNREDMKEPAKARRKEPGSLNHRWEQRRPGSLWPGASTLKRYRTQDRAPTVLSHRHLGLFVTQSYGFTLRRALQVQEWRNTVAIPLVDSRRLAFLPTFSSPHCALMQQGFSAINKTTIVSTSLSIYHTLANEFRLCHEVGGSWLETGGSLRWRQMEESWRKECLEKGAGRLLLLFSC